MAVAIVQDAQIDPGVGTHTEITVAFGSTPTDGNLLIVEIGYSLFGEDRDVTPPAGFTLIPDASAEVGDVGMATYRKQAGAGESNSYVFTVSGSADLVSATAYELSGHDTSAPINQATTNSGSDTTYETGSVTPNVLSTQALAFFSSDSGGANADTVSAGWTYDGRVPTEFHASGHARRNALTADTVTAITATFTSIDSPWVAAVILVAPATAAATTKKMAALGVG